ncbi:MAG: tonB-system energizer ExbB [Gemmobacter sp.]
MKRLCLTLSALLLIAGAAVAQVAPVPGAAPTVQPAAPMGLATPATEPDAPAIAVPTTEGTPGVAVATASTPDLADPAAVAAKPVVHDLSPMGMYRQAHWVVKVVMISLAFACFVTWTVWLYKTVELLLARRHARMSHLMLHAASSLDVAGNALGRRRDPVAVMTLAVQDEFARSRTAIAAAGAEGVKERAASLIERIEGQALAHIRRGTGLLATIGSTAPFVGLFGTVWGIMNSFIGIAETKTTNLAVVAPGIAEALLATAIGLVAAIPAVVIYNHFSRQVASYRLLVGDASAAVLRMLSRDIDMQTAGRG